ncbi:C25 family cysteine peptidase [Desulfolutivibrio sp.]|uniref:C25 family cysteine peptidase n=1 Tax=Desulfolutivibrio sp. TaxID=2773296 RepID=UPI002F96179F
MHTVIKGSLKQFRLWPCMLLFIALSFGVPAAFAETYSHTYRIDSPQVRALPDGTTMMEIRGAVQNDSVVGAPIVPMLTSRLYVPAGEAVDQVEVAFAPWQSLPGSYVLAHGTSPRPMSDTSPVTPEPADQSIYGSDTPYPPQTWRRLSDQVMLGYRLVLTELFPVRYAPASGRVEFAGTVTVTVHTSPAKTADASRLRPRGESQDEQAVLGFIDNDETFLGDAATTATRAATLDRQYLLITTAALQSAFTPLLTHRASSAGGGFTTFVTTVEAIAASQTGRDLAEKIRNYIKDSYANHGARFVVLGGDADGVQADQAVPTRGCTATVGSYSDSYIPADSYYACLDGAWDGNGNGVFGEATDGVDGGDIDWLAEVAVGRIPADTTAEAQTAIGKIIAFETTANPFKALLVGEKMDTNTNPTWGGDRMDYLYEGMNAMSRDTLYDRDLAPDAWTASTLQSMLSGNTYNMIFHLGHANVNYSMRLFNSSLDSITNSKYFFVYTQGCYSSSFDGRTKAGSYSTTDSMGEDFLVKNSHNAFATIGNSRYGWYNPGTYVQGASNLVHRRFVDAVFQSGARRLGLANNASKATLSYTDPLYRWVSFAANLMGDPATPLNLSCTDTSITISLATPTAPFTARRATPTLLQARVGTGCGDVLLGATVRASFTTGDAAVTLYDDGAHQDGAAGDGLYGATWTPGSEAESASLTVTASKAGYITATQGIAGVVIGPSPYVMSSGTSSWVDDTSATTLFTNAQGYSSQVDLGFEFPFFGKKYASMHVYSSGAISFTTSGGYGYNTVIPSGSPPNALVAVYWDDLALESALGSRASWQRIGTSPDSRVVVTWRNVRHAYESVSTAPATFQVILSERTGQITMQYANVTFSSASFSKGASATVGIENANGSDGVQYSALTPSLSAGQAIVFSPKTGAAAMPSVMQLLLGEQ